MGVALSAGVLVYEEVQGRVGPLVHVEVGVASMVLLCVCVCVVCASKKFDDVVDTLLLVGGWLVLASSSPASSPPVLAWLVVGCVVCDVYVSVRVRRERENEYRRTAEE